jgi:hypothetical protein
MVGPVLKMNVQRKGAYRRQHSQRNKGEQMKKYFVRVLPAFLGFAGLAMAAKAQIPDQVVINIPYDFVAAGKTLPAGTYRVNRVSDFNTRELVLSSFENRAAVLVLPTEVESARADKPSFTFEQVGGQHFLTKIETADHVFVLPVSRSAVLQATMKSHPGSTRSGSSGTD